MVGRLPAVGTPVLPEVGSLLRTVLVEADDISWQFTGKGRLRQFVNGGGLLRRTGPEQVDSATTPVLQLRVLGGLDVVFQRIPKHDPIDKYVERFPALRHDHERLAQMLLLKIGGEIVQLLCARCRVDVTESRPPSDAR